MEIVHWNTQMRSSRISRGPTQILLCCTKQSFNHRGRFWAFPLVMSRFGLHLKTTSLCSKRSRSSFSLFIDSTIEITVTKSQARGEEMNLSRINFNTCKLNLTINKTIVTTFLIWIDFFDVTSFHVLRWWIYLCSHQCTNKWAKCNVTETHWCSKPRDFTEICC